ncbi:MAG: aminotransferase class I/II-fold pyridoxal phosphate-dependent enzyme [Actinomycetota bacterium]
MIDSPLVDAWYAARARRSHSMQIPGHKMRYGRAGLTSFAQDVLAPLLQDDIPLQGGADDNVFSGRVLEKAEKLWAEAIGADHARFLVGGSTQGNIAALTSVVAPGVTVSIDRTSHRSAHAGLVTSGATPRWILPRIHPEFGVPIGVNVADIDMEGAYALFVTSPAYVGTITDIAPLAEVCHRQNSVLIVDQAWGAHLDFLPGGGAHARGADVVTTSVHKALTGYSQTAVTSLKGTRVLPSTLSHGVDLTATTSPSATLLASIDATRVALLRDRGAHMALLIEATADARATLARVPGLVVLDDATLGCVMDPLKLTIWVPRTGTTGAAIAAELWQQGIGVEAADADTVIMTVSVADEPEELAQVVSALIAVIEFQRTSPRIPAPAATWQIQPDVVLSPRDAYFAHRVRMPLRESIGHVSTEQFCPYPPGVPLLAPGERVTQQVVEAIEVAGKTTRMAYCSDPTATTIEVVDESRSP